MTDHPDADLVPGMQTVVAEPVADRLAVTSMADFDVVMRGYDRKQVDDYLAGLAAQQAHLRSELDRGKPSFEALGERVSQMLALAEAEADQMRRQARDEASAIREEALREADQLGAAARRELGELHAQRAAVLNQLASIRDQIGACLGIVTDVWPSAAAADVLPGGARVSAAPGGVNLTEPLS